MKDVILGIYCRDNPGSVLNIGDDGEGNSISINPINFFGGAVGHGIVVQETAPPSFWNIDALQYRITDNSISNAVSGILAENVLTSPWSSGMRGNLVMLNNFSNGNCSGINENFVLGSVIADNDVNAGSITNTNLNRSGIRLNSTFYNWLFCNTAHDIGNGLHFANTFAPTYVTRNLMENTMRGLYLQSNIFNNIGNPNAPWDNKWTQGLNTNDTWSDVDANSVRIYHQNSNMDFIPDNNSSPLGVTSAFTPQATTGSFLWQCPSGNGAQRVVPVNEEKNMIIAALMDTITLPQYHAEIKWAEKMNQYRLLLNDDTLRTSDSLLIAFYDSISVSNTALLLRASNELVKLKSGNMMAAAQGQGSIAENYLDSLNTIATTIIPEMALKQVLAIAYEKQGDTTLVENPVSGMVRGILEELFPDSSIIADLRKDESYNHTQKNQLEAIAIQCPYEYGPAVYMARAMLAKSDSIPFRYTHWCELYGSGSNKTDDSNIGSTTSSDSIIVKVYPNPANNSLTVEINSSETDNAIIEFWSLTGAKVKQQGLYSGKNDLSVLELAGGVYYFSVKVNQENKYNGKQVIIK